MWPRQESNLDLELRKLLYYPLYYEARHLYDFRSLIDIEELNEIKKLSPEILDVSPEYFYGNGQQYYTKEFSHHHQSIWPQCFFYPF